VNNIRSRKLEHINIVLNEDVQSKEATLLEYVRLIHDPIPNLDFNEVDLHKDFCGFTLDAPLIITGMTGGHEEALKINRAISKIAGKFNIGFGVGSQRAGIEERSLAYTFKIAREMAPNAFIIANLGAVQLNKGYTLKEVEAAVEMIKANAIAIHLNPGQEVYQNEGDTDFSNLVAKVEEIVDRLSVPVIIKEVGNGLNKELVSQLAAIGVRCFDTAGLGGTSWIKVEGIRGKGTKGSKDPGKISDYWGNPTAMSIVETRVASPQAYIIGSGGIRDGLDAARAISIGADVSGIAFPVLKALDKGGEEGLESFIDNFIYQLKSLIFLVGGKDVYSLWRKPVIIWGRLREEMLSRGIGIDEYLNRRIYTLIWRRKLYGA